MFYDVVGWVGMILVLAAYVLLSTNKIKNGYLYQWLNFFAALLMAIGLFPKNAWFSFSLQVVWGDSCVNCDCKIIAKETNEEKE